MKSKIILSIFYILFIFNSNLFGEEDNKTLKVGLLAPLSGPYSEIGNSLLYSLQLSLEEINDKNVFIIPRDSGFNDKEKLETAVSEIKASGAKIIIGPIANSEFDYVKKFNSGKNLIFVTHYVLISEVLNYSPSSGEIVVSDKNLNIIGTIEINF